jgi:hypothetical protein
MATKNEVLDFLDREREGARQQALEAWREELAAADDNEEAVSGAVATAIASRVEAKKLDISADAGPGGKRVGVRVWSDRLRIDVVDDLSEANACGNRRFVRERTKAEKAQRERVDKLRAEADADLDHICEVHALLRREIVLHGLSEPVIAAVEAFPGISEADAKKAIQAARKEREG